MTHDLKMMNHLVSILERQETLAKFDTAAEREAERLAHALCDLEESFERYVNELFPQLLSAKEEDVLGALQDIGDELRHVMYHLRDSRFLDGYVGSGEKKQKT